MDAKLVGLSFPRGWIELRLADGRRFSVPVCAFPEIRKLRLAQRQRWQILDGIGFTFADSDGGVPLTRFRPRLKTQLARGSTPWLRIGRRFARNVPLALPGV